MSEPSISPPLSEKSRSGAGLPQASLSPHLPERLQGAVWGAFVGDAFCLGSHWIYDLEELETKFPGGVQGFERPAEGHYHHGRSPGAQTHYGDGALVMLQSVAAHGHFEPQDFLLRFAEKFGEGYAGYRDKATLGTLEKLRIDRGENPAAVWNTQNGADDDQPATVSRLAPLVAAHLSDPDLLGVVERATRVCQNNERAVAFAQAASIILRELLQGRGVLSALQRAEEAALRLASPHGAEVSQKIKEALEAASLPVQTAVVDHFGQSCPLLSSFPSAIHILIRHGDSFEDALRQNARAGGDNAGRGSLLGAWLGAHLGLRAIPAEWRERLAARAEIAREVERLLGASAPSAPLL